MTTILEHLDQIERIRREQEPLLRALRLYGELERAGLPLKAETLKGAKLVAVLLSNYVTLKSAGLRAPGTGLIRGVELADGTSILFPNPIQYP